MQAYSIPNADYKQIEGGKQIKPPLIPSNTDKVYTSPGIYNLKGFYEDLDKRILQQRKTIKQIEQNSRKVLLNNNTSNASFATIS